MMKIFIYISFIILSIILISLSQFKNIEAHTYPLFKQCNSQWGNNKLGTSSQTICQAGCLMSCSAMMINSYGVSVSGQSTNPGTLNSWLIKNGGYVSGDEYVWSAVDKLGFSYAGSISNSQIISNFNQGKTIMLNVRGGSHWVLMTGYSGSSTLLVNDPGFSVSSYTLSDVVRAGGYTRTGSFDKIIQDFIDTLFL